MPRQIPFHFHCLNFSAPKCLISRCTTDAEGDAWERPCRGCCGAGRGDVVARRRRLRAALGVAAGGHRARRLRRRQSRPASAPPSRPPQAAEPPPRRRPIGTGQVKVGLILPLSAQGNAGVAAQSMKNAAEMALAEFKNPNIQLLVKDDGGTPQGAQPAAQQALDEGAEIILGPLFAQSVSAVGAGRAPARRAGDRVLDRRQRRRARRLSVELPAGDRRRAHRRLRRLARQALVRRADARQRLWRGGRGRVPAGGARAAAAASWRWSNIRSIRARWPSRCARVAQAAGRADAIFIPDGADAVPQVVQALAARRRQPQARATARHRPVGRPAHLRRHGARRRLVRRRRIRPASAISRRAIARRYGQDPVRTATLAYDAVALVAALVKTQGAQRFTEQVLTNAVGLCRHRRRVPLPPRRHQRARARGAAGRRRAAARWSARRRSRSAPAASGDSGDAVYAARSATTASSTGKPGGVTRRRPSAVVSTAPSSRRNRDALRVERAAGERRVARRVDAFGEPQAHQQEFVGRSRSRVSISSTIRPWPVRLDAHQPGFRALLGRGGAAAAVDVEPAMRAGADAGIFVAAPVDEIVPALGAGPRVIGNFVGRQAGVGADLLRQVVEIARRGRRRA